MQSENINNSSRRMAGRGSQPVSASATVLRAVTGAGCHVEMIQMGEWLRLVGWVDSQSAKTQLLSALPADDGVLRVVDCVRVVH